MLSWSDWAIIAQEKYLYNISPYFTNNFAPKKSATLPGSVWVNTAQGNHLRNVSPWPTGNFYEENNRCNVVSTMLAQYYIGILSSQYCPNISERTLHKKITCAMLAQSAQTHFRRKITYTMLSWSAWAKIAHGNYPCNVDPRPKNNFATLWLCSLCQHCSRKPPM